MGLQPISLYATVDPRHGDIVYIKLYTWKSTTPVILNRDDDDAMVTWHFQWNTDRNLRSKLTVFNCHFTSAFGSLNFLHENYK